MCGIAGIVGSGWDQARLARMLDAQHHRGPDDRGVRVSADGLAGLGHNRLSIIDLSSAGHQPMANADGTRWIAFNGEIYNYRELRAELGEYPYRSQTDTEVLLAAYDRWGPACVDRFIGMFAFAIWDDRTRTLFCARDRVGIKPFYYAHVGGAFVFASEVKAILAAGHAARPDRASWAQYLVQGDYDPFEATFFEGVSSLPPGHTLTLTDGKVERRCYWDLPRADATPLTLSDDDAAAQYLDLVRDAVRLRLRSDVPVGVNLSGGLDSSTLLMMVDEVTHDAGEDGEVQSFTMSYDDPRYDEVDYASDIPRKGRWARHIHRVGPEQAWAVAGEVAWHQEGPFGGISTLAYHLMHRHARERGVTVLLEGQGVDEMLGGYAYARPHHGLDLLDAGRRAELTRDLRTRRDGARAELAAMRALRRGEHVNVYTDGTAYLAPETITSALTALAPAPPRYPRPFGDRLTNLLYRDLRYTKIPRVLRMNDRVSMAFGRELREPFLDHRIVELAFRLPASQKIRDGQGKWLLRHAMRGRLPDRARVAGKRPVVTPQREWLRTVLRPQVEELLHSRSFAERGFFDVPAVHASYRRFCDGAGENAFYVWQWVNTELWCRAFVDGAGARA